MCSSTYLKLKFEQTKGELKQKTRLICSNGFMIYGFCFYNITTSPLLEREYDGDDVKLKMSLFLF
jgi:hypothetical protein